MSTTNFRSESSSHGVSRRRALRTLAMTAAGLSQVRLFAQPAKRQVVVWSEGTAPKEVYPKDINQAISDGLKLLVGWEVIVAGISDPDQGLSDERLNKTDVLIWWGHKRHGEVKDALVEKIVKRVKEQGMGFISLHSSHFAKPNKKLMGTACSWSAYKADGSAVQVIVKAPNHPIARGIKDFVLPHTERYSEPYAVPEPEAVVFDGVYTLPDGKKEPSRQGLCWTVGKGKFFYFQPGHETYPDFFRQDVRQIMHNAVLWAAPL